MTWNESKPALANQISADIPDIWENFDELRDIIEAITTGTVGTTASGDFIANAHTFADNANGNPNISDTALDVSSNVAESSWESVGPTDSGEDNIWTALDSVPTGANWIEVRILMHMNSGASASRIATIYARNTDGSESVGTDNMVAQIREVTTAGGESAGGIFSVKIPVISAAFDIQWVSSFTSDDIDMILVGYGYNP